MALAVSIACVVGVFSLGGSLSAQHIDTIANTEANRMAQARRYLEAVPVRGMLEDMAENMAANMPEHASEIRKGVAAVDVGEMTEVMLNAMVKHFTAEELRALADFYGSPAGKSAMGKFGAYMAEIMPYLQLQMQNILRAMQRP